MNVTYLNYSSIYGHILLEDDFLNNKPFTFDDFLKRFTFKPRSQACFSNVPHGAGSSRPFKIAMEIKIKKKKIMEKIARIRYLYSQKKKLMNG